MHDVGYGQPVLCEGVHAWPWHVMALTASAPCLTPLLPAGVTEASEQFAVTRHGIIIPIVPQEHAFQPGALLWAGPMHTPPRVSDGVQCLAKPRRNRLAPDCQRPVPRFTA
jgi:hypothetical protein